MVEASRPLFMAPPFLGRGDNHPALLFSGGVPGMIAGRVSCRRSRKESGCVHCSTAGTGEGEDGSATGLGHPGLPARRRGAPDGHLHDHAAGGPGRPARHHLHPPLRTDPGRPQPRPLPGGGGAGAAAAAGLRLPRRTLPPQRQEWAARPGESGYFARQALRDPRRRAVRQLLDQPAARGVPHPVPGGPVHRLSSTQTNKLILLGEAGEPLPGSSEVDLHRAAGGRGASI